MSCVVAIVACMAVKVVQHIVVPSFLQSCFERVRAAAAQEHATLSFVGERTFEVGALTAGASKPLHLQLLVPQKSRGEAVAEELSGHA